MAADERLLERVRAALGRRSVSFTGRPMRGFLYVDGPAIRTAAALKKWVDRAVAYASALPPNK